MQLYQNPDRPDHAENNAAFVRVVNEFPQLYVFQPSPAKAPWHWQAVVEQGGPVVLLNFWPHTLKAQRENCRSVEGEDAIRALILEALDDARGEDDFDVIEGV